MFISVVVVNESFVVDMNWATPCGSETGVTPGNIACNAVTHSSVNVKLELSCQIKEKQLYSSTFKLGFRRSSR